MDQVKIVEDSLYKIWSENFLKAVFHKFYLVHSPEDRRSISWKVFFTIHHRKTSGIDATMYYRSAVSISLIEENAFELPLYFRSEKKEKTI